MTSEERIEKIRIHLIGVYNLSSLPELPYFDKNPCECCGSPQGGNRYGFKGRVEIPKKWGNVEFKEYIEASCCIDCFEYLFT